MHHVRSRTNSVKKIHYWHGLTLTKVSQCIHTCSLMHSHRTEMAAQLPQYSMDCLYYNDKYLPLKPHCTCLLPITLYASLPMPNSPLPQSILVGTNKHTWNIKMQTTHLTPLRNTRDEPQKGCRNQVTTKHRAGSESYKVHGELTFSFLYLSDWWRMNFFVRFLTILMWRADFTIANAAKLNKNKHNRKHTHTC